MACAESQFYSDYISGYSAFDNSVGGILWFAYSNIRNHNILRKQSENFETDLDFSLTENYFKIRSDKSYNIKLFDILGRSIVTMHNLENEFVFYFDNLKPGIYNVSIENAEKSINKKFVVMK